MNKENAVVVKGVYKDFKLPHLRRHTVKSVFTGFFEGLRSDGGYEVQHALKNVSFTVNKGEFFGIVGRNGSGKSTLLKLLAGIYQPNSGTLSVEGKLVPFIELGVGFNPELTGRENVYLNGALMGFSVKKIDDMYEDIVHFAELEKFMDQKLKNYSSGMQVRLAFSVAIKAEADILLIDEVLAVGDADFQRKCFNHFQELKAKDTTVIFVTHDMNAVREYCDRAILIEDSKIVKSGSAEIIATEYTKMFLKKEIDNTTQNEIGSRWGDGSMEISEVKVKKKLLENDQSLSVKMQVRTKKNVMKPGFGFVINNASGLRIMGTNTIIEGQKIEKLNKGEKITLEWLVPNIFSDGKYHITVAAIYDLGNNVADWWEDVAGFDSYRSSKTQYPVSPKIETVVTKND